jgi:hypothetical protein
LQRLTVKKQLSFVLLAAALVAALAVAINWPGDAQQRAMQTAQNRQYRTAQNENAAAAEVIRMLANNTQFDGGPRIIHVPQAGEARGFANDPADLDDAAATGDIEIQQTKRALPKLRRVVTPAQPVPRRVLPPADATPKRTVLSAPATRELTPIYPTPRWRTEDKLSPPAQNDSGDISALDLPPEADTSLPR